MSARLKRISLKERLFEPSFSFSRFSFLRNPSFKTKNHVHTVRKAIAIIGLFILASQVALGSASALFLCLCQGEFTHETPCQPKSKDDSAGSCQHDEAEPQLQQTTLDHDDCNDLLIKNAADLPIDRKSESQFVKAPFAIAIVSFAHWNAPRRQALLESVSPPATQHPAPKASEAYTRTVKLLR